MRSGACSTRDAALLTGRIMPVSHTLRINSPRTKTFIFLGLSVLLMAGLGFGTYRLFAHNQAPGVQKSDALAGGQTLEGFVSAHIRGEHHEHPFKEPGGELRTLLDQRAEVVLDPGAMSAPGGVAESSATIDAAALDTSANNILTLALERKERSNRLARLRERLDKVRQKHAHSAPGAVSASNDAQKGVIASGQTISQLLEGYLSPAEIQQMADTCKEVYPLSQVRAGNSYAFTLVDGKLSRFEYDIDREKKLVVRKTAAGFEVGEKQLEFDTYTVRLAGNISLSLFGAVERLGENGALAMRLADIFGWEIDFIRDIRVGDTFRVLVEKRMRNGKLLGYGEILAAEFVNQGVPYQGFLFHDDTGHPGYYNVEGDSLKKAFLKAPLEFSRISSNFTWRRLHPILGTYRPHPGVDYAAPTGTPVKAVGNGTVTRVGWVRGGGNAVYLRHMNGYMTTYMHLSRFARGLRKGDKVEQGEVIGYVGSTGLATGPHLDFRMKHNGQFINPNKVENPKAASLPQSMMTEFSERVRRLAALLDDEEFQPVRDFALDTHGPDLAAF